MWHRSDVTKSLYRVGRFTGTIARISSSIGPSEENCVTRYLAVSLYGLPVIPVPSKPETTHYFLTVSSDAGVDGLFEIETDEKLALAAGNVVTLLYLTSRHRIPAVLSVYSSKTRVDIVNQELRFIDEVFQADSAHHLVWAIRTAIVGAALALPVAACGGFIAGVLIFLPSCLPVYAALARLDRLGSKFRSLLAEAFQKQMGIDR